MPRRQSLAASFSSPTPASAHAAGASTAPIPGREFYQLRRYNLLSGPQLKLTENFFSGALIPTLARMGWDRWAPSSSTLAPETPAYYLLIPGPSIEPLAELDLRLAGDKEFLEPPLPSGMPPRPRPPFNALRSRSWPPLRAGPGLRRRLLRQLRASASFNCAATRTHRMASTSAKSKCSTSGEFDIFKALGFHPVFFGDTLVGSRMPNLTYMLSFADLAELESKWDVFSNDPAWKELSANPALRLRSDRHEHQQPGPEPAGLLANLVASKPSPRFCFLAAWQVLPALPPRAAAEIKYSC